MFWNDHIYESKSKNYISWSQLGDIRSSKNIGASARAYKMLQFIKRNIKIWLSPGFRNNVSVNFARLYIAQIGFIWS